MAIRCPYCGQETDFITTKQAAQLLGWNESTVRTKCNKGAFPGAVYVQGIHKKGMWRIPASAVLPLIEGH